MLVERSVKSHLASVSDQCSAYFDKGAVHDREELRDALKAMFELKGQLCLLLGGKTVGKSLVLAEMAKSREMRGRDGLKRAIVYVDARTFGMHLSAGIMEALSDEDIMIIHGTLEAHVDTHSAHVVENMALLSRLCDLMEFKGLYLCLIIDEASLTFPTPPRGDTATQEQPTITQTQMDTQALLGKIVHLTKQKRKMNCLLVSSEHGYPTRLQHGRFFNTSNFTRVLFAGEVPPAAMRTLLEGEWGLGPRLSDVFLGFYGGHVHMVSQALDGLERGLDDFKFGDVVPGGASGAIASCIHEAGPDTDAMLAVLGGMAGQGFAAVPFPMDARAQALARENVGGLVQTEGSVVVGVPESTMRGAEYGVVPTSHFMRHLIARALYRRRKG